MCQNESGRGYQIVGTAAQEEGKPKIKLVRETCARLEKKDDPRTR